jgi:hypothetical protein
VIAGVGDIQRARSIERQRGRRIEAGERCGAVDVAGAAAGDGGDESIRGDAANTLGIAGVGDENAAVCSDGNAERIREARAADVAVAHPSDPVTRQHGDYRLPVRLERPDPGREPPLPQAVRRAGHEQHDSQRAGPPSHLHFQYPTGRVC